jgi:hypothetical protein
MALNDADKFELGAEISNPPREPSKYEKRMRRVFSIMESQANTVENDAAYGGSYHDGGAGVMREKIRFFKHGMENTVPPEWASLYAEITADEDPEYAEFLRLKAKFSQPI